MNLGYKIRKPRKKRLRSVDGIRRKIRTGFVVLGLLLLVSGTVSYLELSDLSRTTRRIMDESVHSLELAENMLDAVNGRNAAPFVNTHAPDTDSLSEAGRQAIRDFIIDSRKTVDGNTALIRENAYRAIMPGVITLIIALIILIVFYLLIDSYYIRPVLKVRQGLAHYIDARIPYNVQVEGHDEIRELNDQIGTLMALIRKKESNE